jgi:hypothetical protein
MQELHRVVVPRHDKSAQLRMGKLQMKSRIDLHKTLYRGCIAGLSALAIATCFANCADAAGARGRVKTETITKALSEGQLLSSEAIRRVREEFGWFNRPVRETPRPAFPPAPRRTGPEGGVELSPENDVKPRLSSSRLGVSWGYRRFPADAKAVNDAVERAAGKSYQVEIQKDGTSYNIFRVMPPPVGVRILSPAEFDPIFKQIAGQVANANAPGRGVAVRAMGLSHSELEAIAKTAASRGESLSILAEGVDRPERATFVRSSGGEIVALELLGKSRSLIERFSNRLEQELDWSRVEIRRLNDEVRTGGRLADSYVVWELTIPANESRASPLRIYLVAFFQRLIGVLGISTVDATIRDSIKQSSDRDGWSGLAELKRDLERMTFSRPEAFGFWCNEGGDDLIIANAADLRPN